MPVSRILHGFSSMICLLLLSATAACAQNATAQPANSASTNSASVNPAETNSVANGPAVACPAGPAALGSPAVQINEANQLSEKEVAIKLHDSAKAIGQFKAMGVGVAPFERMQAEASASFDKGHLVECSGLLTHLNAALQDQQKSFYFNKMQVWRAQRKNLIAARIAALKNGTPLPSLGQSDSASGLSKASHGVLSKGKGDYKPMIYPIAR